MILELALYDVNKTDNELQQSIYQNIELGVTSISTHPYYINKIRSITNDKISIGVVIDYPYGLSLSKSRQNLIMLAAKQNIQYVDLVVNPVIVKNNERKNLITEIKSYVAICKDYKIEPRIMLDYRMFSDRILFATIELCNCLGITKFIPATGQFVDDIIDNLLNCEIIQQKFPKTQCILNSTFCSKEHFDQIKKHNIHGIRLKSFHFLENRCIFN